jgi:hypothetical protein
MRPKVGCKYWEIESIGWLEKIQLFSTFICGYILIPN